MYVIVRSICAREAFASDAPLYIDKLFYPDSDFTRRVLLVVLQCTSLEIF